MFLVDALLQLALVAVLAVQLALAVLVAAALPLQLALAADVTSFSRSLSDR